MKRTLLLSTLALSATITAIGQSYHMRGKLPIGGDCHRTAAKTTAATASRCIGIAVSEVAGAATVLFDSNAYTYSGVRGGSVMGLMKYDNGIEFQNSGSSMDSTTYYMQTFDSHNNILVHTEQHFDVTTSSFVNAYQTTNTYDAANNKLTENTQTWDVPTSAWVNSIKYTYTYNSANNMTSQTEQDWVGGSWTYGAFDTFLYNSSNLRTMDIQSMWIGTAWDLNYRDTFTYDASNNIATETFQNWDGVSWGTSFQSVYSNYVGAGLYQSMVGQTWDGSAFVNEYKDSITYDTYNQPVYYFEKNWSVSSGSWIPDTFLKAHFYYELYSTGVAQVNNAAASMEVYPNPASGLVNICVDVAGGKNTTITLHDVAGRVVRTIDGAGLKEGMNTIQCAADELPAGTYFLHMTNDKANVTKKVVITK